MTRQIVVEIVGDANKFGKATDTAIGQSGKLASKLQNVGKGMVIGAGIGAFNLLTSGVGMAIDKLGEAQQAYRDDLASQDLLAAAYGRVQGATEAELTAIEAKIGANQRLGVSDSEQREGIAAMLNLTGDANAAMALNAAAIDLSAATGKTYAEALAEIKSGVAGKTAALEKDGIAVEKNASATDIARAITEKYGGAQEALAQTEKGKLAVSHEKVGEAMEKVGSIVDRVASAVIPVLVDVFSNTVDVLMDVWDAIQPVIATIAGHLEPVIKRLAPVFASVFGIIGNVVRALAPIFGAVFGTIADIVGFVFGIIGKAIEGAGPALDMLGRAFKNVGDLIGKIFGGIGKIVKGAINAVIGAINGIVRAINGIQIHIRIDPPVGPPIRFDWNGLNLSQLPYLHSGGIVPGPMGSNVLAVLQAGERVIPRGQVGGRTTIDLNVHVSSDGQTDIDVDRLAALIHGPEMVRALEHVASM